MNSELIKNLDATIKNLEIILSNRKAIQELNNDCVLCLKGMVTYSETNYFRSHIGLCSNANLWHLGNLNQYLHVDRLDRISIKHVDGCLRSMLDALGASFMDSYYTVEQRKRVSSVYPIIDDGPHKWRNPIRWAYVEYVYSVLSELQSKLK